MRRIWHPWLIAVLAAGTIAGCSANRRGSKGPKRQVNRLKFPHETHAEEADCSDCHEGVEDSASAGLGRFVPKNHSSCEDCHDETEEKESCTMCHLGKPRKGAHASVNRHLKFSHAAHKERVKDGCKRCHPGGLTGKPGDRLVPDMAGCVKGCHDKDMARMNCDRCHENLHRYRLKPTTRLTHEGGFFKRHGKLARNAARCLMCHDQTFCAGCHARTAPMTKPLRFPEKVGETFIHRGDFMGRHGSVARAQPHTCRRCHGSDHCITCHEFQGLTLPLSQQETRATRKVHGPDWMTPAAPGFHGRHARRDINRCVSCHDQGAASNCVSCHQVGGQGGNPHPTSFGSSSKTSECRSNKMCQVCHPGGTACGF